MSSHPRPAAGHRLVQNSIFSEGAAPMNEPLTQLHAEAMTAEREWTVEEIPVLSASISLPEPVPAAGPKSPAASGGITSSSAVPSYAIVRRTSCLRRRRNTALLWRPACPAPLPGGADLSGHLQRRRPLEPVYPVPGERLFRAPHASAPWGYLGSDLRLSGASVRLLSPPQRMEAAADGGSGGGDPAAGDGWDLPVP